MMRLLRPPLGGAGYAGEAPRTFERGAIPVRSSRGRFISALQEGEQARFRVGGGADGVVGEQELAERLAEVCGLGLHGGFAERGGHGIRIRIEGGEVGAVAAGPESGAAD